jgi:hypothetical protein
MTSTTRRRPSGRIWGSARALEPVLALVLAVALPVATRAQPSLSGLSPGGGGGTSVAGRFTVSGTIGQPAAGQVNAGVSTIRSGCWSAWAPLPPAADSGELVVNGSFENLTGAFAPDPNVVMLVPRGSAVIPGWTVIHTDLLWGSLNDGGSVLPPGSGTPYGWFYVDLTGARDTLPYAGVTQTVATAPGQNYELTFALGTVQNDIRWVGPISVAVTAGSTSNLFEAVPTGTDWQWRTFSMKFTAASTATPVTFEGARAAASLIALDRVSIRAPAALPVLRISDPEAAGGALRFRLLAGAGRGYAIESRSDLFTGAWSTVPDATRADDGATVLVTISNAFVQPHRFYRVRVSP